MKIYIIETTSNIVVNNCKRLGIPIVNKIKNISLYTRVVAAKHNHLVHIYIPNVGCGKIDYSKLNSDYTGEFLHYNQCNIEYCIYRDPHFYNMRYYSYRNVFKLNDSLKLEKTITKLLLL